MYFDYFQSAFYINLNRRPERRVLFERRIEIMGFFIPRFEAITLDENDPLVAACGRSDRLHLKIGCNLSHIDIVKTAKEKGWENVMIFEDDCVFDSEFMSKMIVCANELKQQSWDLFYMGGEPNTDCLPLSENLRLFIVGGMYGTHSYAINHTFYDRVLNLNPIQPCAIDILYLHMANRRYVITKEMLTTQDDLESDLWGGVIKRTAQYRLTYNRHIK